MKKQIALLHAKTNRHKYALNSARRIIEQALSRGAFAWAVSFSGGKDSTVVAALVRERLPDVPLVWSDDEWYLPETAEYMARINNLHHIRTNAKHAEWLCVDGDWGGIPDYARAQGWDGAFLGLRQDESNQRRVYLRTYGPLHYVMARKQWQCNPIHNWSWRDVWAYIYANDVDYNRAYDRLDEIGVDPEHQRIGPLAVDRVLGYGQLVILKKGWPDLFNRFSAAHPEARSYI